MSDKLMGVLGGVGPLATVYFADMVVKMTDARRDQDHIRMLIYNDASIPDRTAYILDRTKDDPLPVMTADAKKLEAAGCDFIVIPCNTAHFFYDELSRSVKIPIINIMEETVKYAAQKVPGLRTLGVLATEGTIKTDTYKNVIERHGLNYRAPDDDDLASLMNIIYGQVKAGEKPDIVEFLRLIGNLRKECEAVILGCTELTIINRDFGLSRPDIIDSMEVLARKSIEYCGKRVK